MKFTNRYNPNELLSIGAQGLCKSRRKFSSLSLITAEKVHSKDKNNFATKDRYKEMKSPQKIKCFYKRINFGIDKVTYMSCICTITY